MVLHVDHDVLARLRHLDGHDSLHAAQLDVALAHGPELMAAVHHILQSLLDQQVEEMVDGAEVELGVQNNGGLLAVPLVLVVPFGPVPRGLISLELCGQQRDEVDLIVTEVAEAEHELILLRPLHDAVLLVQGEVVVDCRDLRLGPRVQHHRKTLYHGDVVGEGILVGFGLEVQLLQELNQKLCFQERVHCIGRENK